MDEYPKVYIERDFMRLVFNIYIILGKDSEFLHYKGAGDKIGRVRHGEKIEPCLVLDWDGEAVLGALVAAISDKGIKSPDKSFNEGKIDAMERHLEDMRALVFDGKTPL